MLFYLGLMLYICRQLTNKLHHMTTLLALILLIPIVSLTIVGLLIDSAPEYTELKDGTLIKVK